MKHLIYLKPVVRLIKHSWITAMLFITWTLFRNFFADNSYLWWPFKHWIQDHPFESLFIITFIGFILIRRDRS